MNKRMWTKPVGKVQQFQANEYVSLCFMITSNQPWNQVYNELNGTPGFQGDWGRFSDEDLGIAPGYSVTKRIEVKSEDELPGKNAYAILPGIGAIFDGVSRVYYWNVGGNVFASSNDWQPDKQNRS